MGKKTTDLSCEPPGIRPARGASWTAGLQIPPPAASPRTTAAQRTISTTPTLAARAVSSTALQASLPKINLNCQKSNHETAALFMPESPTKSLCFSIKTKKNAVKNMSVRLQLNLPHLTRSSWWSSCWQRPSLYWSSLRSRRRSEPECSLLEATADALVVLAVMILKLRLQTAIWTFSIFYCNSIFLHCLHTPTTNA